MNKAIKDLTVNRWSAPEADMGVKDQIAYWREHGNITAEELDEFNNWLVKEGLDSISDAEVSGFTSTYYDFPGGVEVRQISAHLTGFGAQALQYVARSTRLDGKNKGDVVSDLRKAIDFITWEIERLQGNFE